MQLKARKILKINMQFGTICESIFREKERERESEKKINVITVEETVTIAISTNVK